MGSRYSTREVARLVDLPAHRIQALARLGIVGQQPPADAEGGIAAAQVRRQAFGRPCLSFDFADLRVLRLVAKLLAAGVTPTRVQHVFVGLQQHLDRHGGQLSAVSLVLDNERLLARDAHRTWDAESGQTLMPFEVRDATSVPAPSTATLYQTAEVPEAQTPKIEALPSLGTAAWTQRSADTWFDMALAQEETEPVAAYELYLRALACDPEHVEAMLNIGRLCSLSGDSRRAIAYFKVATAVDAEHPVAHFNMAVTLHDAGELDQAEAAYRAALRHDPYFADAHYNLATLLEQQGERDEASQHFVAYRLAVRPSPPA